MTLFATGARAASRAGKKASKTFEKTTGTILGFLAKSAREARLEKLDCWTEGKRTKFEQTAFKDSLVQHYQRGVPGNTSHLKCMLLDKPLPRDQVRAAHIWKFCTQGEGLGAFGLVKTDLSNPRNGMLLCVPIEEAFDIKRVCFIYDPMQQALILHVLDPDLLNKRVDPTGTHPETFADLHGKPLHFPAGANNTFAGPYRRILGFHARVSFERAVRAKWITEAQYQQFQDYLTRSGGPDPEREMDAALDELQQLLDVIDDKDDDGDDSDDDD